ncbi:hypothetical protein MAQ5080_03308 [Marinomonas aquimarina]|uniref:Uncharacterized protein n=1 Tax=Marinomonas aquimarina TaxID=295068 RepID=A0A1A8TRP8_9GAMM|nr:hypothetical protein [Marinomonas aquimarina]SBS35913.1 hypothetical protein MAQ5080_03308 [Marinomonas aquimarina]
MQPKFKVQIDSFKKISQIDNAWSDSDFKAMLALMGFADDVEEMDSSELKEMCMMSFNDLPHSEAAAIVLTHLFPDLTEGQVDQLSHDMLNEPAWEQYPDCLYHESLFSAYALLRAAFNGTFAQPTGVKLELTVTADNEGDMAIFDTSPHSAIVRLLANGQSDNALIHRLYEDQIQGEAFPEAPGIVWQLQQVSDNGATRQFTLLSSQFWFGDFADVSTFEASSHADSDV